MALRFYAPGFAMLLALHSYVLAVPATAQGVRDIISACRGDYYRFCSETPLGGGRVASCLSEHREVLSQKCRFALGGVKGTAGVVPGTQVLRDLAYGSDPAQRLDVYRPAKTKGGAPVIFMVHGGAWVIGDKAAQTVVAHKAAHWVPQGVIFISANHRMLPVADPVEQAKDIARALAFAQSKAKAWGGDPKKFVLMGHSAGAHLVSLLASDPKMAYREGASPWLGTIALDSAAIDVVKIMENKHFPLFDRAFGADPAYWRRASPAHRLSGKREPILIVCSTKRPQPCQQAEAYAAKAGAGVKVLPVPLSHRDINDSLGKPSIYTDAVDAFLRRLGVPG